MVIQVVELLSGGYKIRKILPKNKFTHIDFFFSFFMNIENWSNGELSKIGHH